MALKLLIFAELVLELPDHPFVAAANRTVPNHSRPASCIADADIDAEDYPERDPQKGH
jgi:hypothetical protein